MSASTLWQWSGHLGYLTGALAVSLALLGVEVALLARRARAARRVAATASDRHS